MIEQLPASWPSVARPRGERSVASAERLKLACELIAFGALGALVSWRWMLLVKAPPAGGGVAIVAIATAGAGLLALLRRRRPSGALTTLAGVAIALAVTVCGLVAVGIPAHLLAPAGWGELGSNLGTGVPRALDAGYPYVGAEPWTRLVILSGAPLILGFSGWLAFAPGSERRSRTWTLLTLVSAFAVATALRAPAQPLLCGLALFAAIAAWLWLGRAASGGTPVIAALLAAASILALPLASALDRGAPLLDYQNWNLDLSSASAQSISYSWDHTYGPLHWPRTGRTLMTVTGTSPQYWRTTVLERFDGLRWTAAGDSVSARYELPEPASRALTVNSAIASLDPRWVHRATFNIDALSSSLVVAPGTVLKAGGLALGSGGPAGVSLPGDETLGDGDHYTVVAYEPDPTAHDLRGVPGRLDPGLRQYTQLSLPRVTATPVPTDSFGNPLQAGTDPKPTISLKAVDMPLYGSGGGRHAQRVLARSSYGPVYELARRVTAHAKTQYGAVAAIERHLRTAYRYSESPPRRELPLRAFLFRDRAGYCQQFSGAMALMLRTLGIPARVASGFSPGVPNPNGNGWAVRDLDAHSWVEVYFNGIGWVPFDPTPAAAPAAAQSSGAGGGAGTLQHGQRRQLAGQSGGPLPLDQRLAGRTAASGGSAWPLVLGGLLVALVATAALALARRRRSFQALAPGEAARLQARELGALVHRLELDRPEGLTLLQLERRLTTIAGPSAGDYVRALRRARFGRGEASPPTLRDRRELRRALFGHGGRHRFLAGIVALPPGAPR